MQSQSDREFQRNVMNFKKTLKGKTTWEDFEEYVGHKIDKGDKLKGFILNYFNRDFEQPYDDGQRYITTTKIICTWRDTAGYLKALNRADYYKSNKDAIKQQRADYRKSNKEAIKQQQTDYYKLNKEAIRQRQADYYKLNKEAIKQRRADYKRERKYYCDICKIVCGSNHDLKQHLKTKKHLSKKSKI